MALPLANIPREVAVGSLAKGGGLRFNEDLSTRPAWYPPSACSTALAPSDWWQSSHAGQSYGRRWWAATGSAESDDEAAVIVQRGKLRAVRVRWLMPHVLSAALQPGLSSSEQLSHLIETMLSTSGFDLDSIDVRLQQRTVALLQPLSRLTAEDLQMLSVASLTWSVRVAALLSQNHDDGTEPARPPGPAAASIAALLKAAVARLSEATTACSLGNSILPGSILNLASTLVYEQLTLLVLCNKVSLPSVVPAPCRLYDYLLASCILDPPRAVAGLVKRVF